ncbi:mucin-4 isoform X2 [Anopheles darlingi]|uniref:mucin-4 isoform X2 n=1 Tax=Anopheles darlingi TaxID=43151 RepID=UPI0021001095|nr:mucin-4 isoform X2 [Anopheles darlingi]
MSSQIPPLVCHTPPPIDFDLEDEEEEEEEDDDDYAPDIPDDDDFGDFATVPVQESPLPTEVVIESREREEKTAPPPHNSAATPTAETITNRAEQTRNDDNDEDDDEDRIPSLVLSPNRTPCNEQDADVDNGDVEDIDFQPFASSTQQPEPPPEDCISLPSLHLDTELSKSDDDDNVPVPLQLSASGSAIDTEIDLPAEAAAAAAAERTTPVIHEGAGRFDDNTENDFTDFTTASNERSSAVLEIPTANDVSFELDDFAQLESTPSADSNFVSQQSRGDFATFDADFSKFDSFQASFPATGDGGESSVPPKTTPTVDEGGKHVAIGDQASTSGRKPIDPLPDDDFDDFQEFAAFESGNHATETFPTASTSSNREVQQQQQQQPAQAMKSTAEAQDSVTLQQDTPGLEEDVEDDDEFGEFSDFKQSTTVSTNAVVTSVPAFSMESVHALLTTMFPITASDTATTTDTGQQSWTNIPENMLHSQLQDFDNTNAVSYQHSKSSSSKALVTALGIDSRNIMYGPKWNSSMPRFAANLSFNPLEPLKPSAALPKETNSNEKYGGAATNPKHTTSASYGAEPLQPSVAGSSVPAAQFDWNSSGLVNPLEGVQEMLQKASPGQPTDGAKGEVLDSKVAENAGPPAADDIAVTNPSGTGFNSSSPGPSAMLALPLDGDDEDVRSLDFANTAGSSSAQYTGPSLSQAILDHLPQQQQQQQQQQYPASQQQQPMSIPTSTFHGSSNSSSSSGSNSNSCPTSSSSVPVMRTIKLPETHIFTPSRGGTPVSRDITDRDIVVREYHDVEYSLESSRGSSRKEAELDEFNDFQSAVGMGHTPIVPIASGYSRPVIGRSPTEEMEHQRQDSAPNHQPSIEDANGVSVDNRDDTFEEDDEFTDFQAAPTIPVPILPPTTHPINKPVSSVQANRSNTSSPVMLLSPAILLPQQTATNEGTRETQGQNVAQINWPEPGVDPDELARFEAAFAKPAAGPPAAVGAGAGASNQKPQATTALSKVKSAQEEDEWTDFMSSKPVTARSMPPTAAGAASSTQAASSAAQEEWTDFISSTPSAGTGSSTSQGSRVSSSHNHFNYSRPSAAKPPNSWSQPQLPPPQFNSWNSNSLYYNPMSSLSMQSPQHPRPSPAATPSSHYAAGPPVNLPYQQQAVAAVPGSYPQLASVQYGNPAQQQMTPVVNLLPELSFITPHASSAVGGRIGGNGGPPSQLTKPAAAAHSFLSNVISSNSFAKK